MPSSSIDKIYNIQANKNLYIPSDQWRLYFKTQKNNHSSQLTELLCKPYDSVKDQKCKVLVFWIPRQWPCSGDRSTKCWRHHRDSLFFSPFSLLSSCQRGEEPGHKLYKNAHQFVLHAWRPQQIILNSVGRNISKRGESGLKYLGLDQGKGRNEVGILFMCITYFHWMGTETFISAYMIREFQCQPCFPDHLWDSFLLKCEF